MRKADLNVHSTSAAGPDEPRPPTDRLFFAILPDAPAVSRMTQLTNTLQVEHELTGKPIATQRLHATVHFLGSFAGLPADLVATACDVAASVRASPFDVCFDRMGSFSGKGRRPVVLLGHEGVTAISLFQEALSGALDKLGMAEPVQREFTPHVTLFYDDARLAERCVEPPVCWTVNEFALVRSVIAEAKYLVLRRWPLVP